jgi:hypothetical protein
VGLGNACDDGGESGIAQDERIRLSFDGKMFLREERKRMLVRPNKWRERAQASSSSCFSRWR